MTSRSRNSRTSATSPSASHSLRLIGGRWRGRVLPFPEADGLRPTGNRIRETLFNWLQVDIPGSRCLDLFAGSGALGFEALSRGAAHCTFVELNPAAVRQLHDNADLLQAAHAEIFAEDALQLLRRTPAEPFDVVFLDPPFNTQIWETAARRLNENGWLAEENFVYVETPAKGSFLLPPNWRLHRQKKAGQVSYSLYCAQTHPPL